MVHIISKGIIPTRLVVGVMLFTCSFINFMARVNMSINLIAMVDSITDNVSEPECKINILKNETSGNETHAKLTSIPDYGTRYDWDAKIQGLILGSYFWGYTITCIPGGPLGEKFGPTKIIMITTLISGVLTILGPLVSSWNYIALIISRFLIGLCGGVTFPCMHCMISRWSPPEERGKFIGSLLGGALGTVVTWPLLGAIIENLGWPWSFFISGGIVLIWCILWVLLVADSPDTHPRISEEEKLYIIKSIGNTIKRTRGLPPYKAMFLSVPFWALIILHFGNGWGLFFLMTTGPKYLSTVLGFNLGHTGILASFPYLARLIFGFIFGLIGDLIRKKQIISITIVRKGFVLFSHFIPGLLLLVLNITGCNVTWSLALLTMSLGSNGASTLTNLQNAQDLAPNYAGSLYGVANCVGSTTGFLTPLILGHLTAEHNGLREWHIIFSIGAAVYIISGLIFCVFGSAELQQWNEIKEDKKGGGVQNPAFDHSSENKEKSGQNVENTKI